MKTTMKSFRGKARLTVEDEGLQAALEKATGHFREGRVTAMANLPDAGAMRDEFKKMRGATLANLGVYLEQFEIQATAAGAQVHWAQNGDDAAEIVLKIAHRHSVTLATKSKSMTTEEIGLNAVLKEAGVNPVETDLGEYIVQLAHETPSHIIAPAIHKTKEQVAELFQVETGKIIEADIPALAAEARRQLRDRFLASGMGITGGNLGVAETGSIVLVTNEGNGRMVTSLPPVHVAVMGIEKIAPTWDEAKMWLALLARSATGQPLSIYTNIVTGPARPGDPDGPEEVHIILLDNNRSTYLGSEYGEILECIRCGACINVCPVYREVGGHAYGSPYSGPIGAVISPLLFGLERYEALPQASSLCGACLEVCPARIDLPRMLLALRRDAVERKTTPWHIRMVERTAGWIMSHRLWFDWTGKLGRVMRADRFAHHFSDGTTPKLSKKAFRDMWRDGEV